MDANDKPAAGVIRTNDVSTAEENLRNSPPVRGDMCDDGDVFPGTYNEEFDAMDVLRADFVIPPGYPQTNYSEFVLSLAPWVVGTNDAR